MDAVLILSGDIPIPLVGRLLAVGVFQMRFQVVSAGEWCSLASTDPALIQTVLTFLVHGLFMALLMFLSFEAFRVATLVNATRIAASEFILGDDDIAINARLALGVVDWLGFERAADAFPFIRSP